VSRRRITDQQVKVFMKKRKTSGQAAAAAFAGISERSARRADNGELVPGSKSGRNWRTRHDPLADVWESVLVPLLIGDPELTPTTLLDHLDDNYPGRYGDEIRRTLQRRVKQWKLLNGPPQEVMFRQNKVPGEVGLSDFTQLNLCLSHRVGGTNSGRRSDPTGWQNLL